MSAHAILSASGSPIWLSCAHAGRAQLNFPDIKTEFSEEGSFAHTYSETLLRGLLEGSRGAATTSREMAALEQSDLGKKWFNESFKEHCESYVKRCLTAIESARRTTPDALVLLEQRLDYSRWVPEGFGTGDLVIVANGELKVRDLKFGKGVQVDAEDNEQLKMYALGAIDTFFGLYDFDKVVVEIDQPRLNHIDSSPVMSVDELVAWGDDFVRPRAALAWAGTGPATAGDHCRFCRARHTCRVRMESNVPAFGQDPNQLTDSEVDQLLPTLDGTIKWANDLKSWAQEQAVTGAKQWTAMKIVAGRSNRVIKEPELLKGLLLDQGFDESVITEPPVLERPLLSLTELEKVVGKTTFGKLIKEAETELEKPLIIKPDGAPTLVPLSDKRSPWQPSGGSVDDDFKD